MRVDFDILEKEIEKLKQKRADLMRAGQYAQAFAIDNDLKKVGEKMKWMVEHEKETFGVLLKDLPEEERKQWEYRPMLMLMFIDMLDTVATDVNSKLLKLSGMYLSIYDDVKQIKRLSARLVHTMDVDSKDDEMRFEWGELSDKIYKMVENKATAYVNKRYEKDKKREQRLAQKNK